jgi:hypothetical protein
MMNFDLAEAKPLSSPRRRGPMRRVLTMWNRRVEIFLPRSMGPHLRGDDTESEAMPRAQ